jgi:hypothetical protein
VSTIYCICFCNDHNGIDKGMNKLKWHIFKSYFCNDIFSKCESCNGIDPINPSNLGIYTFALKSEAGIQKSTINIHVFHGKTLIKKLLSVGY